MPKPKNATDREGNALPTLKHIRLDGYDLDPNIYLNAEYEEIADASAELPLVLGWLAERLSELLEAKYLAAQDVKRSEAQAFFALRQPGAWEEKGFTGKLTDKALERAVDQDESVMEAHEALARYMRWTFLLQQTLGTFQSKMDMVRSTESTRRKVHATEFPD